MCYSKILFLDHHAALSLEIKMKHQQFEVSPRFLSIKLLIAWKICCNTKQSSSAWNPLTLWCIQVGPQSSKFNVNADLTPTLMNHFSAFVVVELLLLVDETKANVTCV